MFDPYTDDMMSDDTSSDKLPESSEPTELPNRSKSFEGLWLQEDYERLPPIGYEQPPAIEHKSPNNSFLVRALLWCELPWVVLLALCIIFPGRFIPVIFQPLIVSALPFFWLVRLIFERRITQRTPIDLLLSILVVLIPATIWVSPYKEVSWESAGYLLLGISLYVGIVNWQPIQRWPWLVGAAICIVGIVLAAIGPNTLSSAPSKLFDNVALEATRPADQADDAETINPNVLAGGLAFVLPILVALSIHTRLLRRKSIGLSEQFSNTALITTCGLAALGIAIIIVLTQSRGAYIGSILACWLVLILRWPKAWPILLLVLAGLGGTGYWFGADQLMDQSAYDNSINSYEGRTEIWKRGVTILFDFPLTGTGIGNFGQTVPQLYPYDIYKSNISIPHAHNMLLQIGADFGLPGIAIFIGLIIALFSMLIRTYRTQWNAPTQLNQALAIGCMGSLMALLVHGLFDSVLWGTKLSFMPWLLVALAVLLPNEKIKKRRRRRHNDMDAEGLYDGYAL